VRTLLRGPTSGGGRSFSRPACRPQAVPRPAGQHRLGQGPRRPSASAGPTSVRGLGAPHLHPRGHRRSCARRPGVDWRVADACGADWRGRPARPAGRLRSRRSSWRPSRGTSLLKGRSQAAPQAMATSGGDALAWGVENHARLVTSGRPRLYVPRESCPQPGFGRSKGGRRVVVDRRNGIRCQ
jgi:hypothetical protein